jgi:hypothetical protein
LVAGLCRKSAHSCSVKSRSGLAGSNSPDSAKPLTYQPSTLKLGTVIAPSLIDLLRSTSPSTSIAETLPRPSQAGHMPSPLNE